MRTGESRDVAVAAVTIADAVADVLIAGVAPDVAVVVLVHAGVVAVTVVTDMVDHTHMG